MSRHLQGAAMWFTPKARRGEWEDHAPNITAGGRAGKWGEARMTRYLTVGGKGDGEKPDPPMPAYKFAPEDARAVTAYLLSLGGGAGGERREGDRRREDRDKD